jgi:dUTP pyrophosphatase
LAVKHHLDTGAGVIDEDYRGPVGVVMFNFAKTDYEGE